MKCLLSRVLRLKCYTASSPVFLTTEKQRISQTLGKIPFPTIGTITITISGIEKQLRGLKADKAYGTDGVPSWFLKENNQEISEFLTYIYQDCIDTGTVPSQWKQANVCFQRMCHSQERKEIGSIKLQARITYLHRFKSTVHSHVMNHLCHLSQYGMLTDYQHGFRAKRSTETHPICTIHDIASTIQSNKNIRTLNVHELF